MKVKLVAAKLTEENSTIIVPPVGVEPELKSGETYLLVDRERITFKPVIE